MNFKKSIVFIVTLLIFISQASFVSAQDRLQPPANKKPVGYLDSVTSAGIARGWAYDPDQSTSSIRVHFYIDKPAGNLDSLAGDALANVARPDVNTVVKILGDHGFEFPIPDKYRDGKEHTLYAYGIDTLNIGSENAQLTNVKTFTLSKPPVFPPPVRPTPSFAYPSDGQTLTYGDALLFKANPVNGATGYLFGFFQNGLLVYENLRDGGSLSTNGEFGLWPDNPAYSKLNPGSTKVSLRAYVNNNWTDEKTIQINLEKKVGQTSPITITSPQKEIWNLQSNQTISWTGGKNPDGTYNGFDIFLYPSGVCDSSKTCNPAVQGYTISRNVLSTGNYTWSAGLVYKENGIKASNQTFYVPTGVYDIQVCTSPLSASSTKVVCSQVNGFVKLDKPIVYVSPSVTVTGKPTLKLSYDSSKKESSLEATQNISVKAGSEDILLSELVTSFDLNEKTGIKTPHGIVPNETRRYTEQVGGNASLQKNSDAQGNPFFVYRVKAGQTANFKITLATVPSKMYAGVYTVSLNKDGISAYAGSSNYFYVIPFTNSVTESNSVTVVGENANATPPSILPVGKPTLKLSYDSSKKESSLEVVQNVSVKAGSEELVLLAGSSQSSVPFASFDFKEKTGVKAKSGFLPNERSNTAESIEGLPKEKLTDVYGNVISGWRIKPGQTANFKITLTTVPNKMYAGAYTALLNNQAITMVKDSRGTGLFDYSSISLTSLPTESDSVTIVGENVNSVENLIISSDPNTRKATTIVAAKGSQNNELDSEEVASFRLTAQKDDILINKLVVTASSTIGQATQPKAYLFDGNTLIGSAVASTNQSITTYSFDSLLYPTIKKDDTRTLSIRVDIRNATTIPDNFMITSVAIPSAKAKSSGNSVSVSSLSNVGNTMTFVTKGVRFNLLSANSDIVTTRDQNANTTEAHLTATFNVEIVALATDVQFDTASSSFAFKLLKNGSVFTPSASSTVTVYYPATQPAGTVNYSLKGFTVPRNSSITIPVTFKFDSIGTSTVAKDFQSANYAVKLYTVKYGVDGSYMLKDYSNDPSWKTNDKARASLDNQKAIDNIASVIEALNALLEQYKK